MSLFWSPVRQERRTTPRVLSALTSILSNSVMKAMRESRLAHSAQLFTPQLSFIPYLLFPPRSPLLLFSFLSFSPSWHTLLMGLSRKSFHPLSLTPCIHPSTSLLYTDERFPQHINTQTFPFQNTHTHTHTHTPRRQAKKNVCLKQFGFKPLVLPEVTATH